ncbi:MAG TPA: DUF1444 family protein [Candidatus Angelobacter sp.]|nr:DUF1444 family protein [Candidatus Angelobacter sp.]
MAQHIKDKLEKADLTRDEFFSLCIEEIKARFAPRKIDSDGSGKLQIVSAEGKEHTLFLHNLWIQCRKSPGKRGEVFEQQFAALAALFDPSRDPPVTKENVIAIIKDQEYVAAFGDAKDPAVREHLVADLWIVYALDLPRLTQSLEESKLKELKIEREELRSLALTNLRNILPEIEQQGEGPWYWLSAGGDYTASLLLFDDLWSEIEESVEGDIVAAVPARDVVLFTGSRSQQGIEMLRHHARDIAEGGHHVVSQTLLRRIDGKWKVFA